MRIISATCALALLLAACEHSNSSDEPGGSNGGSSSGGTGAVAGTTGANGGTSGTNSTGGANAGGSQGTTGGSGGAGATSTGGSSGTAGDGGMPGGGSISTGGSDSGGVGGTGGSNAGGSAGTGGTFVQPPLVTSADGAYWVTTGTLTEAASGTADVTVNEASPAQTWEGFGGSFNEKGWAYLLMLGEADRSRALQLLFGRDGLNLTFGRIPIGATDYSTDRYSLDEVPSGQTDIPMANFSIARDRMQLIPYVKAAQAVKSSIHFWASPWSPPTWMKTGPFNDTSPFDGGSIKTDSATLGALALYFVKFVQAYGQEGINVETISPQNEPGYSGTYPTCAWPAATYATFVGQHLAPAFTQAGLTTKFMLGTFNGGTGDTTIVSTVMGDATASAKIAVLGYQWGFQANVANDRRYNRPIWQTEHKCGNYPWLTPFNGTVAPNDRAYAVESWGLFRDWIKSGVTSYSVWNMVLDTVGIGIDSMRVWPQNALLTVNTTTRALTLTPTYYVYRHFTQFVQPGAVLVGTTGGDAVAFKNPDGSIATIMYNSGAAKAYVVAVGGKRLQFQMPAAGWATVLE
jgi:glucosylceramidase